MTTVTLAEGSYEFDLKGDGQMVVVRKNGLEGRLAPEPAGSIMQDWTFNLGLRHQGVLVAAVRGCDTAPKEAASKTLVRYYRSAVLNAHCGDPRQAQSFIELPFYRGVFDRTVKDFLAEKDALPTHFVMHFLHAAEIVGYYHPQTEPLPEHMKVPLLPDDAYIPRAAWHDVYLRLCRKLHLNPETKEQLDARLNRDEDSFGHEQRNP